MVKLITIRELVSLKRSLELQLLNTKDIEKKKELNYNIGKTLAIIILEGKDLSNFTVKDVVHKKYEITKLKSKIQVLESNSGTDLNFIYSLYKQFGLKENWVNIVERKIKND